jgi:CheY-like chemotaxis protein
MSSESMQKVVMVVDDVPANLSLLEEVLTLHGYRALLFPKAELALQAAQEMLPDLILLDIQMPGMSGFQMCEELKRNPGTQHIPVIFVSGNDDKQEKTRARAAGGVDFIVKPFDVMGIGDVIARHIKP